jgi:hypothetical protein
MILFETLLQEHLHQEKNAKAIIKYVLNLTNFGLRSTHLVGLISIQKFYYICTLAIFISSFRVFLLTCL